LGKLVDRRLLRSDQRADNTYYELSHDTLVEPVLATSRARRKLVGASVVISGTISLGFGGLLALIALITAIFFSSSYLTRIVSISLIMIGGILFVVGVSWYRSGIRTFRR
jgi:cytochrome c biogenesis protein CcdA